MYQKFRAERESGVKGWSVERRVRGGRGWGGKRKSEKSVAVGDRSAEKKTKGVINCNEWSKTMTRILTKTN